MQVITAPIIRKFYAKAIAKTAVECNHKGQTVTVFVNGDKTDDISLLCNIVINEPGDTFVASKDSTKLDDKKKPLYTKGQTVTRKAQSYDFKSFAGNNRATEFAQGASAFGLQLIVQM